MPREKYRVHEVAKDFGINSKKILEILENKPIGANCNSPSAIIFVSAVGFTKAPSFHRLPYGIQGRYFPDTAPVSIIRIVCFIVIVHYRLRF